MRVGGGHNHRFNLADAVLLKDNHLAALRSRGLESRRRRPRHPGARSPHDAGRGRSHVPGEIEAALAGGADIILLDNMSNEEMRRGRPPDRGARAHRVLRQRHAGDRPRAGRDRRRSDLLRRPDPLGAGPGPESRGRGSSMTSRCARLSRLRVDHPGSPGGAPGHGALFAQEFGNPSNLYPPGRRAAEAREQARAQVAARPRLPRGRGRVHRRRLRERQPGPQGRGPGSAGQRHLVTTAIEHSAVLGAARGLQGALSASTSPTFPSTSRGSSIRPRSLRPSARTRSWSASCSPTTRSGRFSRSPRSRGWPGARCPVPHRRRAGGRLPRPRRRSARGRPPLALRATSSTRPRGWASSTSGAGRPWRR